MSKNELPEDGPDELSNLLIDRDTCEYAKDTIVHTLVHNSMGTPTRNALM